MKRVGLIVIFSFVLFGLRAQKNKIFNGKNLDGWIVHGSEKWYVDEGELICESGPDEKYGYLSTVKFYNDFILTLDFKQESNGNSGVFFRSRIEGTKISGWQVEGSKMEVFVFEQIGRASCRERV